MTFDTISQLIRIAAYAVGSYFLGTGVADGELFQAAIAGGVSVVAFVWWMIAERNKAKA
jgi:hypothetical protein